MDLKLKNKVALVCGASKGIGKAIAQGLADEGARVCIVSRDKTTLSKTAQEIHQSNKSEVLDISGDVSDPDAIKKIVDQVQKKWKQIDILVNNAGGPPPGSFLEQNETTWNKALQQNFMSVVRLATLVVPGMKKRKWGRIINLTSTIAKEPSPFMVLSASARSAVAAFSKAIAVELASHGITVNTVCPGSIHTERAEALINLIADREKKSFKEIFQRSEESIPLKRMGSPKEIADMFVFLASDQASYLTGTAISVDGGLTKGLN